MGNRPAKVIRDATDEMLGVHPFAHELSTGEDVVTFYYPPADGSIESLRKAAQDAAEAEQQEVDLYVMPRDGDEWVLDATYEPRTIND
jgi:hypothetical protein